MSLFPKLTASLASIVCSAALPWASAAVDNSFTRLPPSAATQVGAAPDGTVAPQRTVLANEPNQPTAGTTLEFDLAPFTQNISPLARLVLRDVEKLKVSRPNETPSNERGVIHVRGLLAGSSVPVVVATFPVTPGGTIYTYTFDVTRALNAALAQPPEKRKLHLSVQLTGKPLASEIYGVPSAKAVLEIASPQGWIDDWQQRLAPIDRGTTVYREASLPMSEKAGQEVVIPLLYPPKKIVEVIANASGTKLTEGRDWVLREGKLVLPAGTRAPVQINAEFFTTTRQEKDGTIKRVPTQIRLMEGSWYHERQIEVTYEPASRPWTLPAPVSKPDQLPRWQKRLAAKQPVTVILFGDSISAGFNASAYTGVWPYQPSFGDLVTRALARTGSAVTFFNHSRGGETSLHATNLADSQVGWFKPDLVIIALGMNDRTPERRPAYRANLEKIIDTIRGRSPETEIVLVTPMLNSPSQPTGLDPVKDIQAQGLAISRPGLVYVDMTATQLELIAHKSYLDLSGNGVNHPNDFLIRIYAQRIAEVLLPATTR